MDKRKRNYLLSAIFVAVAVLFTILVKVVDVKAIGPEGSSIGFSKLNQFVFEKIGVHMVWYHITDWLGLVPILMAVVYAVIGLIQLIKRKSLFKVDKEIWTLGAFYIFVVGLYFFFEFVIVNYRPVLMEGILEASYPSSHTLMTLCLCGSSIIINRRLFNNNLCKCVNVASLVIMFATILGRLVSGVHWFTDIVGGVLISLALLMTFYSVIESLKKENQCEIEKK